MTPQKMPDAGKESWYSSAEMPDRLNRGVFHMSYEIFHMTYEIFSLCLCGHLLQHSCTSTRHPASIQLSFLSIIVPAVPLRPAPIEVEVPGDSELSA